MTSNNIVASKRVRTISNNGEIIHKNVPENNKENQSLSAEQKTQLLTEGAKIINRVMDVVHLREQTDASLRTMDKEIELVERTTEAEIKKMFAQTESWERRFNMVSKVLQEMTITVTTNKDLHPEIAKALIDTVRTMVEKISVGG